jgi:hypothetical protein
LNAARIAVPDLVSYSSAAAETVFELFNREGLDVMHELVFLNDKACHWAICALAAQALPARKVV